MKFKLRTNVNKYRNVVACDEEPMANKVKTCYCGVDLKPMGLRKKVNARKQFIPNGV